MNPRRQAPITCYKESINRLASRAQMDSLSLLGTYPRPPFFLRVNRWFPGPKAHVSNHTIQTRSQSPHLFKCSMLMSLTLRI